jgi:hypothetical protein
MAEGARARFGSDLAVATRASRPTGGSAGSPSGWSTSRSLRAGSQCANCGSPSCERNRRLTAQIASLGTPQLLGASLDLPRLGRVERKS